MEAPLCRVCGMALVVNKNVTQCRLDHSIYICRACKNRYELKHAHRTGRYRPMSKNKECSSYLGVYVAERVLSYIFKDVERMPMNNPGYDFICNRGKMIDAKSSCRHYRKSRADQWTFHTGKNKIADYFLCLAFDNRESLNPEHIWLIPASDIKGRVGISESTLTKWSKYELPIDQVVSCCNVIR